MADKMLGGRVVRYWGGLVSWLMMPLQVRFSSLFAVVLALAVCAGTRMQAQNAGSQNPPDQNSPAQPQSSSSQSQPTQAPTPQGADTQNSNYGVYISVDPLAKVRYDNRYDVSLGLAYDHMKAGPSLLQGSNLGGLDADGSVWLTRNWGIEGSGRAYVGTSGTRAERQDANGGDSQGPMVKQYFFVGGAEWLGPHNKHGAMMAHAMFGGVYGNFQKDLLGQPPANFDFYYNQIAPAAIIGGSIDLNRSEHWVFRINPDASHDALHLQRHTGRSRNVLRAVRRELRHLRGRGVQVHEGQAVHEKGELGFRLVEPETLPIRPAAHFARPGDRSVQGPCVLTADHGLRLARRFVRAALSRTSSSNVQERDCQAYCFV